MYGADQEAKDALISAVRAPPREVLTTHRKYLCADCLRGLYAGDQLSGAYTLFSAFHRAGRHHQYRLEHTIMKEELLKVIDYLSR